MKSIITGLLCLTLSTLLVADKVPIANTPNGIFELINQRLACMQDVALFKARNHHGVEDLARERQVLHKALKDAGRAGLQAASTAGFFQAQMDAAKAIQHRYMADWLSVQTEQMSHRDLASEVRPVILKLGDEIIIGISDYLKAGGTFDDAMLQNFVKTVNVTHLSRNDKKKLFRSLQMIRLMKP